MTHEQNKCLLCMLPSFGDCLLFSTTKDIEIICSVYSELFSSLQHESVRIGLVFQIQIARQEGEVKAGRKMLDAISDIPSKRGNCH